MTRKYTMQMAIGFVSLFAASVLTACSTLAPVSDVQLKPGTEWVANSSGWREEASAAYSEAAAYVETMGAERPDKSWAVVLDLDETVLNNVAYQVSRETRGESYSAESWYDWTQQEKAALVPGAKDFIDTVNERGGHIVFVTNRRDFEQLATEKNLAALGITRGKDFRLLITRAAPKGISNKSDRFALVPMLLAAQGYPDVETIAYVGDNKGDKPANETGWQFFCIDQGGMYGDPCAAIIGPGR